jgi:LPXTG-site transpeptidase (sortase) family protein
MIIGLALLVIAALVWALLPGEMTLPERLELAIAPGQRTAADIDLPTPIPLATRNWVSGQSWPGDSNAEAQVLLPETPLVSELPSYAFYLEAPRAAHFAPVPGQPVWISIPALDIDAEVTAVGLRQVEDAGESYLQWDVPDKYASGWHSTSGLVGETGNIVLNGHHNIFGEIFRDLSDLRNGDEIILESSEGKIKRYSVALMNRILEAGQSADVRLENARWLEPTKDQRLTLISCWPYATNTHRVVVVAIPIK